MATPSAPRHRLEARRVIPAPAVHVVRRSLARVILGPPRQQAAPEPTSTTGTPESRLPLAG